MITDDFLNATVDFNLLSLRDLHVADNGIAAADRAGGKVKMRVTVGTDLVPLSLDDAERNFCPFGM